MSNRRAVFATILIGGIVVGSAAPASAQVSRSMIVLLDASGTMLTTRPSDGQTRFSAAKT